MYVYRSRVLGEEEESRGGAKRHHPWVLQLLVAKSMSSAPCTSPYPNDPMTASTRWHDVLTPPPPLRCASTSSRRRWSSCVPAQHTRKSRSAAYRRCQPGPQHAHSYAQMRAPLMLLRPMRTWGGLGGQPGGTRGGGAAGIIQIRVAAAAAASRPTARTHRIPECVASQPAAPLGPIQVSRPCAYTRV